MAFGSSSHGGGGGGVTPAFGGIRVHLFYVLLIALVVLFKLTSNSIAVEKSTPVVFGDKDEAEIVVHGIGAKSESKNNGVELKNNEVQVRGTPISAPINEKGGRSCAAGICEKLFDPYALDGYRLPGRLAWEPTKDRYLLMLCNLSQLSNRIMCLLNYVLAAGLLNRTLLVPLGPEKNSGYDFSLVFDMEHAKRCLGSHALLSAEEFTQALENGAPLCVDEARFYNTDGFFNLKEIRDPWYEQVLSKAASYKKGFVLSPKRSWPGMDVKGFIHKFGSSDARILTLGDLFYFMLESGRPLFSEGGDAPFIRSQECAGEPLVVKPHPSLVRLAGLVRDSLVPDRAPYLAMHWRRGDFAEFCQSRVFSKSCYYSVEKTFECLKPHLAGFDRMVLATNAQPAEIAQLSSLIQSENPQMTVVTLNSTLRAPPFEKSLRFLHPNQTSVGLQLVEKLVCANSTTFIGNYLSSFSRDIERYRYAFGTASERDKYLCIEE